MLFALALAVTATPAAFAAGLLQTPDCDVSGETLNCKLLGVLDFLYGAVGILALVLLVVVIVAIQIYRKNRQPPKDGR